MINAEHQVWENDKVHFDEYDLLMLIGLTK